MNSAFIFKFILICLFLTAYFVNMTWCVTVGCNCNSFTKDQNKGLKFFRLPKDDNLKMASKYQEKKSTKNSKALLIAF